MIVVFQSLHQQTVSVRHFWNVVSDSLFEGLLKLFRMAVIRTGSQTDPGIRSYLLWDIRTSLSRTRNNVMPWRRLISEIRDRFRDYPQSPPFAQHSRTKIEDSRIELRYQLLTCDGTLHRFSQSSTCFNYYQLELLQPQEVVVNSRRLEEFLASFEMHEYWISCKVL